MIVPWFRWKWSTCRVRWRWATVSFGLPLYFPYSSLNSFYSLSIITSLFQFLQKRISKELNQMVFRFRFQQVLLSTCHVPYAKSQKCELCYYWTTNVQLMNQLIRGQAKKEFWDVFWQLRKGKIHVYDIQIMFVFCVFDICVAVKSTQPVCLVLPSSSPLCSPHCYWCLSSSSFPLFQFHGKAK